MAIRDPEPVEAEANIPQESRVGKKLSDLTTRRVIILVLSMLIAQPFFLNSTFQDEPDSELSDAIR
jgi:hypothetical protein